MDNLLLGIEIFLVWAYIAFNLWLIRREQKTAKYDFQQIKTAQRASQKREHEMITTIKYPKKGR